MGRKWSRGAKKGKRHDISTYSLHAQTIGTVGSPETIDPILSKTVIVRPLHQLCAPVLHRPFASDDPSSTITSRQPCQTAEYDDRTTRASSADAPGRPAMAMLWISTTPLHRFL